MATPIETVLSRFNGNYSSTGKGWLACCPVHGNTDTPALVISEGDRGGVVFHCHAANCDYKDIVAALGLTVADVMPPAAQNTRARKSKTKTNWPEAAAHYASQLTEKMRDELLAHLKLPANAVEHLMCVGAWTDDDHNEVSPGWTFPEFNESGAIVGIARRFSDHSKGFYQGGNRGVYLTRGWADRAGPIYLVEGPTDTMAMACAGLTVIGRPSNSAGADVLVKLLEKVGAARLIVVVGENDQKPNGDWPGRDGAERTAARLSAGLRRPVQIAYPPDGAKDVRVWMTAAAKTEPDWLKIGEAFREAAKPCDFNSRICVMLGTDEYAINTTVCEAISSDPDLYIRAGTLVRVVQNPAKRKHDCSFPPGPRIIGVSLSTLREHISRRVDFVSVKKGEESPAHPPDWCVGGVKDRGVWPNIRTLESVVDYPVMRPDGSILTTPGYDAATDIFYHPSGGAPVMGTDFSHGAAVRAWDELKVAIHDFPFKADPQNGIKKEMYQSAWLAGVLTPLARFAFRGPAPLFLVDGNVRGAGKGLLCDTISIIVSGREFATTGFTSDDEEMRKRITAIAVEGDRLVLLDNITGNLAGSSLDRALTSTLWKDRLLGHTQQVEAPLWATWYGTGNNVQVEGDTARRICHIRIETPDEHPEDRDNFLHKNLRAWIVANRQRLLGAALTILSSFAKAGFPVPANAKSWGSYEGWSGVVRNAIIWLGLPDPGDTRTSMRTQSDVASSAISFLIANWEHLDTGSTGLTAAQVINKLFPKFGNVPDNLVDVAAAIEALLPRPNGGSLGYKFRHFQRRTFGDRYLDHHGIHGKTVRWGVFNLKDNKLVKLGDPVPGGDGGDQGDAVARDSQDGEFTPPVIKTWQSLATASPPSPPSPPKKTTTDRLKMDFGRFDDSEN